MTNRWSAITASLVFAMTASCGSETAPEAATSAATAETATPSSKCQAVSQRYADRNCAASGSGPVCEVLEAELGACALEPPEPTDPTKLRVSSLDVHRLCDLGSGAGRQDPADHAFCVSTYESVREVLGESAFQERAQCVIELATTLRTPNKTRLPDCSKPLRLESGEDTPMARTTLVRRMAEACAAHPRLCGTDGMCGAQVLEPKGSPAHVSCATTPQGCSATVRCEILGECSPVVSDLYCGVKSDADCSDARVCKKMGRCRVGVNDPESPQFSACVTREEFEERADGRPWVELTLEGVSVRPDGDEAAARSTLESRVSGYRGCLRDVAVRNPAQRAARTRVSVALSQKGVARSVEFPFGEDDDELQSCLKRGLTDLDYDPALKGKALSFTLKADLKPRSSLEGLPHEWFVELERVAEDRSTLPP